MRDTYVKNMIVDAHVLPTITGKTTMVAGGFDPLHEGHIAYFQAAAQLGLPVLVSVDNDMYITRKHPLVLSHEQRGHILNELRSITYVYLNPGSTADALRNVKPKVFVKGVDWKNGLPQEEVDVCKELGIEIQFVDTIRNSSTQLIRRLTGTEFEDQALAKFEDFVLCQTMPRVDRYDAEYFQGDWRNQDRYDLESRRKIEGRHPEVIKEVFQPKRVIDLGCGPGFLMHLLKEVGIDADGLDISPSSPVMAPPGVRDRIQIGSIVDADLPDQAYDLVICREVLEHLPVIDVHRAVQNMCRMSSRFVYVTTRFHPAPATLLDVTNEFHVDPTHMTLMNKNFLRLMFVLAGFRRREDLEEQMDWMNKHRVLVYERARDSK